MSRFLFVVPPLAGHVYPTIGLGEALMENGHDVAWSGSEVHIRPMLGPDAAILATGTRLFREQGGQGLAAVKSLWEGFIVPYARFTISALDKVVKSYEPDVLLVDQHTPAGALVAHRNGLRWASITTSTMEICRPFGGLPKVEEWMTGQLQALWAKAGLPPAEYVDPRFSPELIIAMISSGLTGPMTFADHYALVGPVIADRPEKVRFPWKKLDPERKHVLVTMGTLAEGVSSDFHGRALEALARLGSRVQGVVVAAPEALAELPPNVIARPRVPMLELLPKLDLVVCHGGLNTVHESLAHGVPLVIAPIRHDQPINAAQVTAAGAGRRVSFARVTPGGLGSAIEAVLDDDTYHVAAQRLGESFTADGGAVEAVRRLEALP